MAYGIYTYATLPSLEIEKLQSIESATQVYSSDGKLLGSYYLFENRVELETVPSYLLDALVATEDVRFYDHPGVDFMALIRAFASAFTGRRSQGGSTLTMQLARNLFDIEVGRERTMNRKVKEMFAAVILERNYTKAEIMIAYLNTVPFGGNNYGIQSAAKVYFNKSCNELTVPESAMLVGMLQAPTKYNPRKYPDQCLYRRNIVLSQMMKYGFITQEEFDKYKQTPLGVANSGLVDAHNDGLGPYFREYLRSWLKDWCAKNGKNLYADGLKIYTTIDSRMQKYAEEAVIEHLATLQKAFDQQVKGYEPWKTDTSIIVRAMKQSERFRLCTLAKMTDKEIYKNFRTPTEMRVFAYDSKGKPSYIDTLLTPWDSLNYYAKFLETGVITIDPSNGNILAWVGGVDHQFFKYDHVKVGKRQVGSTFKPFVYAAYIKEKGGHPCEEELNQPITIQFGDKEWSPKNSDGLYTNKVSLKKALTLSLNVVTARILNQIDDEGVDAGILKVIQYARQMGVESKLDSVPALCLGVADLSVYEMTNAFATFANGGVWVKPVFVSRIEDRFGNVLYDAVPETRDALDSTTAFIMVEMLRNVVNEGTAANLRWQYELSYDIDIGGKTGTTQNQSDGWFIGFTPMFVTGVWVGHGDRSVHFPNMYYGQGAMMAMPIWGKYMKKVYADKDFAQYKKIKFQPPESMDKKFFDCATYKKEKKAGGGDKKPCIDCFDN